MGIGGERIECWSSGGSSDHCGRTERILLVGWENIGRGTLLLFACDSAGRKEAFKGVTWQTRYHGYAK